MGEVNKEIEGKKIEGNELNGYQELDWGDLLAYGAFVMLLCGALKK